MRNLIIVLFLIFTINIDARDSMSNAYGKYKNLQKVIYCSRDRGRYGSYHDSGYWRGGSWCGQWGPAGYWVWAYPKWYVWGNKKRRKYNANNGYYDQRRSSRKSAYGKYSSLKQTLRCPEDRSQYGRYMDYGYWQGGRWCGQYGKRGYWVWSYPNWYVWKYRR